MTPDPLSQVESMMWAVVEGHKPITDAVRVANRLKLNVEEPFRANPVTADIPELVFLPRSLRFNVPGSGNSSSSCSVTRAMSFLLTTGTLRTERPQGDALNQLQWEMFVAFERARFKSAEAGVGMFGLNFIRTFNIETFGAGLNEVGELGERLIAQGWRSVMDFSAILVFNRQEVIG